MNEITYFSVAPTGLGCYQSRFCRRSNPQILLSKLVSILPCLVSFLYCVHIFCYMEWNNNSSLKLEDRVILFLPAAQKHQRGEISAFKHLKIF